MLVRDNSEKTTVFSIRIKDSIKAKLEEESKLLNINACTLTNQILTKYLEWDRFGKDIGSICITKKYLKAVLDDQDKHQIIHIAKFVSAPNLRDIIMFMHDEITYTNILVTIKEWLERSHFQFRFVDGEMDSFIIQHGMGDKWPLHFITMIQTTLEEVSCGIKEIDMNADTLYFKIVKNLV